MTSRPDQQTIIVHILPDISRNIVTRNGKGWYKLFNKGDGIKVGIAL